MKITLFTIREIGTGKLIYAEGIDHSEFCSNFAIDPKWFTPKDIEFMFNESSWYINRHGTYSFDEEIRHLSNYYFDKVEFLTNEQYEFINDFELKKV